MHGSQSNTVWSYVLLDLERDERVGLALGHDGSLSSNQASIMGSAWIHYSKCPGENSDSFPEPFIKTWYQNIQDSKSTLHFIASDSTTWHHSIWVSLQILCFVASHYVAHIIQYHDIYTALLYPASTIFSSPSLKRKNNTVNCVAKAFRWEREPQIIGKGPQNNVTFAISFSMPWSGTPNPQ